MQIRLCSRSPGAGTYRAPTQKPVIMWPLLKEPSMPTIEKASFKELQAMQKRIAERQTELMAVRASQATKKIHSMLKEMGIELATIFPMLQRYAAAPTQAKASPAKAAPVPSKGKKRPAKKLAKKTLGPKYADPKNSKLVWSGHGKRPAWFKAAQKGGVKPEDMLIRKVAKK